MSLDLLDFPLWPRGQEELTPNESQFDLFLPEIDINIPAVQETQAVPNTVLEDIAGIDISDHQDLPYRPQQDIALQPQTADRRVSTRKRTPTAKYLAMFE